MWIDMIRERRYGTSIVRREELTTVCKSMILLSDLTRKRRRSVFKDMVYTKRSACAANSDRSDRESQQMEPNTANKEVFIYARQ